MTITRAQFQAKVAEVRKLAGTATPEAFERFVCGVEALIGGRGTLQQVTRIWVGASGAVTQPRNRPFWRSGVGAPGTVSAFDATSAATVEFVDGVFTALVELVIRLTDAPAAAFTAFTEAAQSALSAAVRTLVAGGLSDARQCADGRAHRSAR